MVPHLFFPDSVGHLRSIAKKIKIGPNFVLGRSSAYVCAKCIGILVVVSLLQLVAEAIVGIFEVKSWDLCQWGLRTSVPFTYSSSSVFWNA
jgi:hypothetical protein